MPHQCSVHNCHAPVVAKGLCNKRYMRVVRHGDVIDTRPADWGVRTAHPAYKAWRNLLRHHRRDIPENWATDFWAFVQDVPVRPENNPFGGRVSTHRTDSTQPWSKDNFYWRENRRTSEDTKEYVRKWHRDARAANPDYYADKEFRKRYGVSLAWYRENWKSRVIVALFAVNLKRCKSRAKLWAWPSITTTSPGLQGDFCAANATVGSGFLGIASISWKRRNGTCYHSTAWASPA